jgi:hypothetical protein
MLAHRMPGRLLHQFAGKMPRTRKIHCFCLGAAKTGTTSLASMFASHYRAAHEPECGLVTQAVAKILGEPIAAPDSLDKRAEHPDIAAWLRARDRRLNLEVEASHPLGYMAPWLAEVFPDAGFLITPP